jgi:hypothetical protein
VIHIFGVDHWLQPANVTDMGDDATRLAIENKRAFATTLEIVVRHGSAGLVGEECKPGEDTIARRLADRHQWAYVMVDMPEAERTRQNIPPNYANTFKNNPAELARCHSAREQYMFDQIRCNRRTKPDIVVICGVLHLDPLRRLFVSAGDTVDPQDLTKATWFKPP